MDVTKKSALRELIIKAADDVGYDGAGRDGVLGYLKWLANEHPKVFGNLLGRIIPLEVVTPDGPQKVVNLYDTPEKLAHEMRRRGLPIPETLALAWAESNVTPLPKKPDDPSKTYQ